MSEEGKLLKDYQPSGSELPQIATPKASEQAQRPMRMDSPTAVLGFGTNRRSGSSMNSPKPSGEEPGLLPFQITVDGTTLVAAPGLVVTDSYAATSQPSPSNGTWLFVVGVTINDATGVVTSTSAAWLTSMPSNTATTFYKLVADIGVILGEPDIGTLSQYDYGPISVIAHGTPTNKWGVTLY